MDDDIQLTPIPSIIGAPGMNLWIDDLRRAAVLADRERRAKQAQPAKPKVQSREQYAIGTNCGWCGRGLPGGAPPLADHIVALQVELAERTRERDEAVGWIRVVGEECSSGGDRNTTLAKLRTDQRELAAERKRREAAEALLRSGYTTAELIAHFARYKD